MSTPKRHQVSSPLDPYMADFLVQVIHHSAAFSPTTHAARIAQALDVPTAFVECLVTSAQTRGLLRPEPHPRARGRVLWTVSIAGQALIDTTDA